MNAQAADFRWEPCPSASGALWAYSGRHIIGSVLRPQGAARWRWRIDDVQGSRHQPATRGESATVEGAKRALRRAWLRWLADRGLQEISR